MNGNPEARPRGAGSTGTPCVSGVILLGDRPPFGRPPAGAGDPVARSRTPDSLGSEVCSRVRLVKPEPALGGQSTAGRESGG